jgi:hypothetical protein
MKRNKEDVELKLTKEGIPMELVQNASPKELVNLAHQLLKLADREPAISQQERQFFELATQIERTCPSCGHTGQIEKDFGWKIWDKRLRPQSWCRNCRKAGGRK